MQIRKKRRSKPKTRLKNMEELTYVLHCLKKTKRGATNKFKIKIAI